MTKLRLAELLSKNVKNFTSVLEKIPVLNSSINQWRNKSVETYIISFPKCGRTWLRVMIGSALIKHFNLANSTDLSKVIYLEKLHKINPVIPNIQLEHDDDAFFKKPDELTQSKCGYRSKKVIFLVRDPRDVVVSTYFHKTKRHNFMPNDPSKAKYAFYEGGIHDFIREQVGSFETLINYYNIWEKNRSIPDDFLLVRYEDISLDPKQELKRVLEFLNLRNVSDETIDNAVQFASFGNMRKMEENAVFKSGILKPINKDDYDTYKTRKGKVQGFFDHLTSNDIRYLNSKMEELLSDFYGYS